MKIIQYLEVSISKLPKGQPGTSAKLRAWWQGKWVLLVLPTNSASWLVSLVLRYPSVSVPFQVTLLSLQGKGDLSPEEPLLLATYIPGMHRVFEIAWHITCLWSYWFSPPHRCPSGSCTSRGAAGHWSRDTCQGTRHQPRTCFLPAETGLVEWAEFHHHSFQTYPGSSTTDNHKGWELWRTSTAKTQLQEKGRG